MPFGLFQTLTTSILLLLVFMWQWLPGFPEAFLACVLAALLLLLPPGRFGFLAPLAAAMAGGAAWLAAGSLSAPDLVLAAGDVLLLLFWRRRQDVGDYLGLFVIVVVDLFLALVFRRPLTSWQWGFVPATVMTVVVYAHLVRMRYDMETHTIVKHRLGRQSRRVDVARLLQSRRALDMPVLAMMLAVGGVTAAFSMGIVHAASPLLGRLHFRMGAFVPMNGDFPDRLDLARMGRPVVKGRAQILVHPAPAFSEPAGRYWRGQVYDRLEHGIWYRRSFVKAPAVSHACVEHVVERRNPRLTDGFAPLGLVWAAAMDGSSLPVSDDGRVAVPPDVTAYRVCVSPDYTDFRPSGAARAMVSPWVELVADAMMTPGGDFDAAVRRVLEFLAAYEYDDIYPKVPAGRDPLLHFLFFSRSGPCGLFSSVAAVFLARAGIPVRLVTGFSPGQENAAGLVMTAAHAHSWVEAWHPVRGWVVVDPTRAARQEARHSGSTAVRAMLTGFGVTVPLFAVLLWFWWRRASGRPTADAARPAHYAGRISQTKLEAQMLFHEWIQGADFADLPRRPGENVRDYALRLEEAGHPRAADVRQAAQWASRVLFAPIGDGEKVRLLEKLRGLLLAPSAPVNGESRNPGSRDGSEV